MAETIESTHGLSNQQWDAKLSTDWLGRLIFKNAMSTTGMNVIKVQEQLTKAAGDKVTIGLRAALAGEGVTGSSQLEGHEESLQFSYQDVSIDQIRHAVELTGRMSQKRVAFNLREEARMGLTDWLAYKNQRDIVKCFSNIGSTTAYGDADETAKDAWLVANKDRVVFGAASAAYTDHSADLLLLDGTADKLTAKVISTAKRKAKLANPKIRPVQIKQERGMVECYVMYVTPYQFRDLLADTTFSQAQREAMARKENHPLFMGQNQLYWDGVLVVECEDCLNLPNVGSGSTTDVGVAALCGAEAVVFALGGYENGQRMLWEEEHYDYKEKQGFAIGQIRGIQQSCFNGNVMHSMVRVYTSNVADA